MQRRPLLRRPHMLAVAVAPGLLAVAAAFAGRPLTVDDAGTNAGGEGHVEAWAARADHATTLNLSPAYAIRDGVELSALLARDIDDHASGRALQIKVLLTPSRDSGCNLGTTLGALHASGRGPSTDSAFVNGLLSCNGTPLGSLHLNVGAIRTPGHPSLRTWGLALEREFGAVTPHVEWFGAEGSKPTWQMGARGDAAKSVQLDGTIGRSGGITLYSVGLKLRF